MTGGNCLGFAVSWKNGRPILRGSSPPRRKTPQSVRTTDAQLSRTQSQSAAGRAWSWRRDSNPRPSDYKSDALPLSYASPARLPAGLTNKEKNQKGSRSGRGRGQFFFPPPPAAVPLGGRLRLAYTPAIRFLEGRLGMSRGKQALLLLAALAAVTAVIYWAWRSRPEPPAAPETLAGLSWLPAESGLVAGIDLAAVRQQPWLGAQLGEVAGGQTESADYRAFVAATGFDYTRDLDRVWLGVRGSSEQPTVAGVAEGRFVRDKILAHARQQRATLLPYRGLEVYEVETRQEPRGRFAFAFLDDSHVAFGSDAHAAAQVVDCWQEIGR